MTERRRFQVVPPDWGETHLTPEAVVAYVDGELAPGPDGRARRHLQHCPDCAVEVVDQRNARSELRAANAPTLPTSLLSSLQAIPREAELPPPPAGLSMTEDGQLVSMLRPQPPERRRRRRLGSGAVAVSGLAIGALAFGLPASGVGAASPSPAAPFPGGPASMARFATTPGAPTPLRPAALETRRPSPPAGNSRSAGARPTGTRSPGASAPRTPGPVESDADLPTHGPRR